MLHLAGCSPTGAAWNGQPNCKAGKDCPIQAVDKFRQQLGGYRLLSCAAHNSEISNLQGAWSDSPADSASSTSLWATAVLLDTISQQAPGLLLDVLSSSQAPASSKSMYPSCSVQYFKREGGGTGVGDWHCGTVMMLWSDSMLHSRLDCRVVSQQLSVCQAVELEGLMMQGPSQSVM